MNEQDDKPRCKTCIYCARAYGSAVGSCRVDPPKVRIYADYTNEDAIWPSVSLDDDWCGRHPRMPK